MEGARPKKILICTFQECLAHPPKIVAETLAKVQVISITSIPAPPATTITS